MYILWSVISILAFSVNPFSVRDGARCRAPPIPAVSLARAEGKGMLLDWILVVLGWLGTEEVPPTALIEAGGAEDPLG